MAQSSETYEHEDIHTQASFRVLELLPGQSTDPVSFILHLVDWSNAMEYEAISYAWGSPAHKEPVFCQGRELHVTPNLQSGLRHFRLPDQSRMLWADAICINQSDISERSSQVGQMLRIYQTAKTVLVWLGPDSDKRYAQLAVDSIRIISDFLCQRVGISISDLSSIDDVYQQVVFKNRDTLPLPNECEFSTEATWNALKWFYSQPYFTRVWAIQEVNANKSRLLYCGNATIEWDRVALVAGYIIMETAFSKNFGFTGTYCWWAAIVTTERIRQPKNWLFMLYLASNFVSTDPRDQIYGLRGLMKFSDGAGLLDPDYGKTETEVYRDSVEAGFGHFQNADVLLYRTGNETPSWIPRWNQPMVFRNPFRFGKEVPWNPAGDAKPRWSIDKTTNVLSLSGFVVDTIKASETYNENIFGNAAIQSEEGRNSLNQVWQRILAAMASSHSNAPFGADLLAAVATSFSYGLDEKNDPGDEHLLLHKFIAYLKLVLDDDIYKKYISADVSKDANQADGLEFGKPIWDFKYPDSSFLITETGLIGCCISTSKPGDMVYVALGSKYPFVLRPKDNGYLLRGFAYVHGVMRGEKMASEVEVFCIQ